MAFVNRCIFLPTSGGTGTWTVSSAKPGFLTPAQAGAIDATGYKYTAEIRDGAGAITAWEVGSTTYTVAGTTLTRTVLLSSNANALVNFASPPEIMICVTAEDLNPFPVPVVITDTTASTATDTGALRVAGGAYIAKAIRVGTSPTFDGYNTFNSGSATSGGVSSSFNKDRNATDAMRYSFSDVGGASADGGGGAAARGFQLVSPVITDPVGGAGMFPNVNIFHDYDTLTAPASRNLIIDLTGTSATAALNFSFRIRGTVVLLIAPSGAVTTNYATHILGSTTTITGGSTANVPTLTSGPVTGNPTKWLPYNDNGTTRYIPSW